MFVGFSALGLDKYVPDVAEPQTSVNNITIKKVWAKELFVTTYSEGLDWETIPEWGYGTVIHATFEENLSGGNILWSADVVSEIRIKKRFIDDDVWKTIYVKKNISKPEDFDITFIDYTEPSNKTVEYQYYPIFTVSGTSSPVAAGTARVESRFDRDLLIESYTLDSENNMINRIYPMIVDQSTENTYNASISSFTTFGSKHPFVNQYGLANYYSGSTTCTFIEICINDLDVDVENAWKYRETLDRFLLNGYPKLMKAKNGKVKLISVSDNITHQENGHYQNVSTTFNWLEVGDSNAVGDLYDNGFINTDIDRSLDE